MKKRIKLKDVTEVNEKRVIKTNLTNEQFDVLIRQYNTAMFLFNRNQELFTKLDEAMETLQYLKDCGIKFEGARMKKQIKCHVSWCRNKVDVQTNKKLCKAHYSAYDTGTMEICNVKDCKDLVKKNGMCHKHALLAKDAKVVNQHMAGSYTEIENLIEDIKDKSNKNNIHTRQSNKRRKRTEFKLTDFIVSAAITGAASYSLAALLQ